MCLRYTKSVAKIKKVKIDAYIFFRDGERQSTVTGLKNGSYLLNVKILTIFLLDRLMFYQS